jgi:hypothetical protein
MPVAPLMSNLRVLLFSMRRSHVPKVLENATSYLLRGIVQLVLLRTPVGEICSVLFILRLFLVQSGQGNVKNHKWLPTEKIIYAGIFSLILHGNHAVVNPAVYPLKHN